MPDQRFLRQYRLLRGADFERVFARRCSVANDVLVIYVERNAAGHPRLGLVVSKRVGNAVRRNRWRRVLREAFRLSRTQLPHDFDILALPRADATPTLRSVSAALVALARRAAQRLAKSR